MLTTNGSIISLIKRTSFLGSRSPADLFLYLTVRAIITLKLVTLSLAHNIFVSGVVRLKGKIMVNLKDGLNSRGRSLNSSSKLFKYM